MPCGNIKRIPLTQLRNWQSLQWDNLPDGHWGKKQSLQAKIDALLAWDYLSALDASSFGTRFGRSRDLRRYYTTTSRERVHQLRGAGSGYRTSTPLCTGVSTSGAVIPAYKVEMGDQPRAKVCGSLPLALQTTRWAPRSRWLWLHLAVPPPLAWWTVFEKRKVLRTPCKPILDGILRRLGAWCTWLRPARKPPIRRLH